MKNRIGYCGFDCEKCDARIATIHNDDALREKTAKCWAALNDAPITAEMISCMGCREDGVKTPFCEHLCKIRICAQRKGLATCGICGEMASCAVLRTITDGHPEALDTLCRANGPTQ